MLDLSLVSDSPAKLAILLFCAVLVGMSKTGIQGINTISIPLMALAFGGKESTGLILPMLCFADLVAVIYYRKEAKWTYIIKLLPMAVCGFFLALFVDKIIPPKTFEPLMAFCIFVGLAVMFWSKNKTQKETQKVVGSWWYSAGFGLLGGFTTMIGNAAGPVMGVYMLSQRLPKYAFVGTSAWFFLLVNYLKLPLQIFAWDNISYASISVNIISVPCILFGAVLGLVFVKKMPEQYYQKFIVFMIIVSTLALLVKSFF